MSLLFLALTLAAAKKFAVPKIAFIEHHRLYVLFCQPSGTPARSARSFQVCNVGTESELTWTPQGELQVGDKLNGYLLITPRMGKSILRRFPPDRSNNVRADSRIPSPTGFAAIAFWAHSDKNSEWRTDAYIVDPSVHSKELLAADIDGAPQWSPTGDVIALVRADDRGGGTPELVEYPSLKVRLKLDTVVNSWWNEFSPDGRWISRSCGNLENRYTEFFNVKTGEAVKSGLIHGYQTHYFGGWSHDSRHYLESYGAQDSNDRWSKSISAIGDILTYETKPIPGSESARGINFAFDGRHFIWLAGTSDELLIVDIDHPSRRRIIAYDVTSYAVSK